MITDLPTKRISNITVTKISRRFTYKMAAKNGGHRYETKLRHCHPMVKWRHKISDHGAIAILWV